MTALRMDVGICGRGPVAITTRPTHGQSFNKPMSPSNTARWMRRNILPCSRKLASFTRSSASHSCGKNAKYGPRSGTRPSVPGHAGPAHASSDRRSTATWSAPSGPTRRPHRAISGHGPWPGRSWGTCPPCGAAGTSAAGCPWSRIGRSRTSDAPPSWCLLELHGERSGASYGNGGSDIPWSLALGRVGAIDPVASPRWVHDSGVVLPPSPAAGHCAEWGCHGGHV